MEGTNTGTTAIQIVRNMVEAVSPNWQTEGFGALCCEVTGEAKHVCITPHSGRSVVCSLELLRGDGVIFLEFGKRCKREVEVITYAEVRCETEDTPRLVRRWLTYTGRS